MLHRRSFTKIAAASLSFPLGANTTPTGRMKLGTQHGSTDEILRTIAALGVTHICSSLPSAKFDESWSVEGLTRLRERLFVPSNTT